MIYPANDVNLFAKSPRASVFPHEQVIAALGLLESTRILKYISAWQAQDRAGVGGRPEKINFKALFVAMMLLRSEHAPQLTTELSNVYFRRLTVESKALLGLDTYKPAPTAAAEAKRWFDRADSALKRLLELVDPYPGRKVLKNAAERRYERSLIDAAVQQMKVARLDWLVNEILEMSILTLSPEARALWLGDVSIDRTKIPAVSKRGRPSWRGRKGPEPDALIMEDRAGHYAHDPETRTKDADPNEKAFTWAYIANIATAMPRSVDDTVQPPEIAVGFILGTPAEDSLSEETIRMLSSIRERGHAAGRATTDMEYYALQKPHRLALPSLALGYQPLTDYRRGPASIRGKAVGNVGGAIQVEGRFYCPAMPKGLITATDDRDKGRITNGQYHARIEEERPKWEARRKERPDENGAYPIMCPAIGPSATVDCPLRKLHPKANSKARPLAEPPAEHLLDRICTQTSVKVSPGPEMRYLQPMLFGSRQWERQYGHDRAAQENYNGILKDGSLEDIENRGRRRARGFAAAALFTAMSIYSTNLHVIATWEAARVLERTNGKKVRPLKPYGGPTLKSYVPRLPQLHDDGTVTMPGEIPLAS